MKGPVEGTAPIRRRRRLASLAHVAAILATLVGVVWVGLQVDRRALVEALRGARTVWLVLALTLEVARLFSRAMIWRVSLHVAPPVPFRRLVRYTVAAVSASMLTPARAGEALRVWLLRREHGVPVRASIGVALGEKVLDAWALLVLVLPLPWLVRGLPSWVAHTIEGLAVVGIAALVIGWWIAGRGASGRVASFFQQIRILREPRTLALAFLAALAGWLLDLGGLFATLWAVGVRQGYGAATFVLLVINAALVVPSTPGNLGALEAGAVLALSLLDVERSRAVAAALLYHAVQLAPLLAFAILNPRLIVGARSKRGLHDLAALPRQATKQPSDNRHATGTVPADDTSTSPFQAS